MGYVRSPPPVDYGEVLERASTIRRNTYNTPTASVLDSSDSESEDDDLIDRVKTLLAQSNRERSMRSHLRSTTSQPNLRYSLPQVMMHKPKHESQTPKAATAHKKEGATIELEKQFKELQKRYDDEIEQLEVEVATERTAKTRALLELSEMRDKLTEQEQEISTLQVLYKNTKEREETVEKAVKGLEESIETEKKANAIAMREWEEKFEQLKDTLEQEREQKVRSEKERDDTREEIIRMTSDLGQDARDQTEFVSQLRAKLREAESLAAKNGRVNDDLKAQLEKERLRAEEASQRASTLQDHIKKESESNEKLQRELKEAKVSINLFL